MKEEAKPCIGTPVVFGIPDEVMRLEIVKQIREIGVIQRLWMEFNNKAHGRVFVEYIPKVVPCNTPAE